MAETVSLSSSDMDSEFEDEDEYGLNYDLPYTGVRGRRISWGGFGVCYNCGTYQRSALPVIHALFNSMMEVLQCHTTPKEFISVFLLSGDPGHWRPDCPYR